MTPWTRRGLLAAAIAGFLVAAYAAAGYWLAPRFVRDALIEQADRQGLVLGFEDVRTDPFRLSVALSGVELQAPDGTRLAAAQEARAALAWASLWKPAWIVQEASLHRPIVALALGPDGALSWPVTGGAGEGKKPAVKVQRFVIEAGRVSFIDRSRGTPASIELEELGLDLRGLSTQSPEPAQYEIAARLADGGSVTSQGSVSLQPLGAKGTLEAAGIGVATAWQLAAPGSAPPRGTLQASAAYVYDGGRLLLQDVSVEAAQFAYAGTALTRLALRSPKLAIPSEEPFEATAQASLGTGGGASARGSVALKPFRARLQIEAAGLSLAQAQRWVPENVAVCIASGRLSAKGRLHVAQGEVAYEGAAMVDDARFEQTGSGDLLLGWKRLETQEAKLRLSPFAVDIGELVAQAPQGRLIIGKDGRLNFADAMRTGAKGADEKPFQASVQRLRVEKGTLEFADRSLDEDFAVKIHELSGAVTGFSTAPGDAARVQLAGRVEKYGSARIRGTVNLDEPKSLTDVSAAFRNLDLVGLTPYIVKFAGYRVESGRLSADLRYRVREGRLVGENRLMIERLNLGEKVESASALDLPIELAIALLSDAQGRINLGIPVRGDLNDPQLDLGGLVAKAVGNVVGKLAAAPFRALASILGSGGKDLGEVRFAPGAAALSPPAQESVAQLAAALKERPQLEMLVRGGYDPARDLAALRVRAVRREIAQRAGYEAGGPLDFSDARTLHAAENLYLDRVGNRLEMLSLRDAQRPYGNLLVERLAAATPVEPGTLETLARARAETVRAALLEHGVDASRVQLEGPATAEAGKEGVPTLLSLNAAGAAGASAGASR